MVFFADGSPKTLEEAKAHRYNVWAGCPGGTAYREGFCAAKVWSGGRWSVGRQCRVHSGYGPSGLYCLVHARKFPGYEDTQAEKAPKKTERHPRKPRKSSDSNALKVGDTVWVFDENHRVYERNAGGYATGSPIYREHWVQKKIVGETTMSWVLEGRWKVRKSGNPPWFLRTREDVDDMVWAHENQYKISDAVAMTRDPRILKAIAKVLGFPVPQHK